MTTINLIFQFALLISVALTALQFIRRDDWWIRVSDFPHIQLTVLTGIFLVGIIITNQWSTSFDWILFLLATLTLGYQFYIIFPYTKMASKQAKDIISIKDDQVISILESNVYQYNSDYDLLINEVERLDPDLLITLETDEEWEKGLSSLDSKYKYTVKLPLDNTYGILLYSKLTIVEHTIEYLIDENVPSVHAKLKMRDGSLIQLYVLHPEPPSPTENHRSTERDAELVKLAKIACNNELPTIVAGDLNDVAWSHTTRLFQRISGLLDPRIGRGFFNTFHADYRLMRWPLDHVFVSSHFFVSEIYRAKHIGSDHFPMYIELMLDCKRGPQRNEAVEEPSEEDRQEAKKKLEKVAH